MATEIKEAKITEKQESTPPAETHYIVLRDVRIPIKYQTIVLNRGDVIDDPDLINRIKSCYPTGRLPMRPLSHNDLLDRGLL